MAIPVSERGNCFQQWKIALTGKGLAIVQGEIDGELHQIYTRVNE